MCMCDYHALPYREEVAWDVDNIYMSHDTRELYLHDFDYLEPKLVLILTVILTSYHIQITIKSCYIGIAMY